MFRASPSIIMDKELQPSSSQNPITGDWIATKASTKAYRDGYDRIFGKKKEQSPPSVEPTHGRVDQAIKKLWEYYDQKSKGVSPDAQKQSNQTCEDCPQQAEAVDSCSESTCAVRSGLLNRN